MNGSLYNLILLQYLHRNMPLEYYSGMLHFLVTSKIEDTIDSLYPWIPHPQIQSTMDSKYLEKNPTKFQKIKTWIFHVLGFTLTPQEQSARHTLLEPVCKYRLRANKGLPRTTPYRH